MLKDLVEIFGGGESGAGALGGEPANLQGIWNEQTSLKWDSKYTININLEMNYWPAEKTNLSELHEPLISLVKNLAESGRQTAQAMYGCRGWVAHHNTDIWRITGVCDRARSGMWPSGSAWLTQHLWEHYVYQPWCSTSAPRRAIPTCCLTAPTGYRW